MSLKLAGVLFEGNRVSDLETVAEAMGFSRTANDAVQSGAIWPETPGHVVLTARYACKWTWFSDQRGLFADAAWARTEINLNSSGQQRTVVAMANGVGECFGMKCFEGELCRHVEYNADEAPGFIVNEGAPWVAEPDPAELGTEWVVETLDRIGFDVFAIEAPEEEAAQQFRLPGCSAEACERAAVAINKARRSAPRSAMPPPPSSWRGRPWWKLW